MRHFFFALTVAVAAVGVPVTAAGPTVLFVSVNASRGGDGSAASLL